MRSFAFGGKLCAVRQTHDVAPDVRFRYSVQTLLHSSLRSPPRIGFCFLKPYSVYFLIHLME